MSSLFYILAVLVLAAFVIYQWLQCSKHGDRLLSIRIIEERALSTSKSIGDRETHVLV